MKTFAVTFACMLEAESMEDAARQALKDLSDQMGKGEDVPLSVDDMETGERRFIMLCKETP